MGRIRTIKPEFFKHGGLFDAEYETDLPLRLAFAGLWTCCDREGRFKWRPRELKLDILPHDECDFSRVLDALHTRGFIVKYASGSEHFGAIPSWSGHQFINNKEPKSTIPEPPKNESVDASVTRELPVIDANETRGVKEGKGKEGNGIEPKPSRAKNARAPKDEPTKTDLAKARHAEFKAIIGKYWESKNPGVQMPWDGREGKHLEMFLRAAPDITAAQFRGFLKNRYRSEVNHGERPSQWIDWVTSYAAGPMDRFGKTIGASGSQVSNPGSSNQAEKTEEESRAIWESMSETYRTAHPWGQQ